jgi:probable rRNA maturation factor
MIDISIDKEIEQYTEDIYNIAKIALEKINKNIYFSIQCITKSEIKDINNKYRNIDNYTDVLSFPVFNPNEIENIKISEIELGDIFLCLEVIDEQSKEYNTGFKRELLYMITHGLCHLLGYDHENQEDKLIMREKEEYILNKIGVNR